MHIAFATPESPYSDDGCGVAAYLRAIVPAIAEAGHRITVVAGAREEKSFTAENGQVSVQHFRLPSTHWHAAKVPALRSVAPLPLRQFEWSRAFRLRVARVAANAKIDVIESTEIGALYLHRIAPLVIRLHGSERLFREHSGRKVTASVRWNDALEARACARASAITAPSESHAREAARRRGWPSGRVRVIPNPVSQQLLDAASRFQRNGNSEQTVLYTGRLAPVKGIETLLAAVKLVRASDPSIEFVLAGPWQMPKPPASYGLTEGQTSGDGVRWLGAISKDELVDCYKRAGLFVMPSFYESFGISVLEAMAFGLPVITTSAVGNSAGVVDEDTASIVPSGDPAQLARGIIELLSDNGKRARLAQSAQNGGSSRLSPSAIAAMNIALYEEVARGPA